MKLVLRGLFVLLSVVWLPGVAPAAPGKPRPRNVVFVLVDDLRWDALGVAGHPFLETPHVDALARGGAQFRRAFVTTSLCSPSRASILTGQYAHTHRVVDNNHPIPRGTVFFPQLLKKAGYETALVGKWHMGGDDAGPQPGFDHWVSFAGQGNYWPGKQGLNVDGRKVEQKGYITDELTDYALAWLEKRSGKRPFFLYLSHKGVHADFAPATRHKGRYAGKPFRPPATMTKVVGAPRWAQDQRNSWHGVDFPYHSKLDVAEYHRRYAETLLAVDESVGRVVDHLRRRGLLESTLIMFMGDNGFAFGEHGLIDKRTAYEESMRVPLVMHCPDLIPAGRVVDALVANIDIAPTVLAAAGLPTPRHMHGRDALPLARGKDVPWRQELLYEYYWERNFPQTPTLFALRTSRWKYVRPHGLWDVEELYDLERDPGEAHNLALDPAHAGQVQQLNRRLFELLASTEGSNIPVLTDRGRASNLRRRSGAPVAPFPSQLVVEPEASASGGAGH